MKDNDFILSFASTLAWGILWLVLAVVAHGSPPANKGGKG